jgi:TPR repeat protein
LGFLYQQGAGVPKDFDKALKYYKSQADQKAALDMQMDVFETVSPEFS